MKRMFFLYLLSVLLSSCDSNEIIFSEADTSKGFNYPYYLYIPKNISTTDSIRIIIEPNNSGFVNDNFNKHKKSAKKIITNKDGLGIYISENLNYPLLVPVFPRSKTDWKTYTHALDRDVILQKNNPLERINLQLLKMIENAKIALKDLGIVAKEKVILTGFSASGTFANRFTAIHPNKVEITLAGGLNGILFIPRDTIENQKLNYPIGTNDFKKIFAKSFDSKAFKSTPQFLFMGKEDTNDATHFADAYDKDERELIYKVLGKNMQEERWVKCIKIYSHSNVNGQLKTFKNIGHVHDEYIRKEIVDFISSSLNN